MLPSGDNSDGCIELGLKRDFWPLVFIPLGNRSKITKMTNPIYQEKIKIQNLVTSKIISRFYESGIQT